MAKVLFFSPYILWVPHHLWEVTLAFGLQQRGAKVKFVNCGGLPDCAVEPKKNGAHTDHLCQTCTGYAGQFMRQYGLSHEIMRITPEIQTTLRAWVDTLTPDEMRTAHYKGFPLGEWVHADIVAYYLQLEPDVSDSKVADTYRDYLYGAAAVVETLPKIIEEFAPDVAITLNGSFFLNRTALELLRRHGVRVIAHERGLFDNTLMFNENAPVWHGDQMSRYWEPWKTTPLVAREIQRVEKILQERRRGRNMGWAAFSPLPQDPTAVLAELGIPTDRPIALMCTTVNHEASLCMLKGAMPQEEWIADAVAWFAKRSDITLVIRAHPAYGQMEDYQRVVLPELEAQRAQLPSNVKMILPHEEISTYTLMDLAACCITYGSTVGLEMACAGLPVVHAGRALYRDAGFTLEVKDRADYPRQLERALRQGRSSEVSRLAYRFTYHFFTALSYPVKQVLVSKDYLRAKWTFTSKVELAAGRDPGLDRLMDYLLGKAELYPAPDTQRQSAAPTDEDRFLLEQHLRRCGQNIPAHQRAGYQQ